MYKYFYIFEFLLYILYFIYFIGCDSKRKTDVLDYLNGQFQATLRERKSIPSTYSFMVASNPYRVLSSYSYDWDERPLRSNRVAKQPPLTDNGSSDLESATDDRSAALLPAAFRKISTVSDHDDFIQLVINAKTMADLNGFGTEINWRGYTTSIPTNFKLTRENLKYELISGLQSLSKITENEQKVFYFSTRGKLYDIVFSYDAMI